jgi:hypothetical protein
VCTEYSIDLSHSKHILYTTYVLSFNTTPPFFVHITRGILHNNLRHGKGRVSINNGLANRSWPTNELFEGIRERLDDWEKCLKGNEGAPEPAYSIVVNVYIPRPNRWSHNNE